MFIGYIICKNKGEAERLSLLLLEKRLASCTNFFPIQSRYIWKGKTVKAREYVLLAKTQRSLRKKLQEEVSKAHSYELPCIAFLPFDATTAFKRWTAQCLKQPVSKKH